MKLGRNLKKLRGDASTRTFFRKKKTNTTSIIVYAYKDKKLNLLIYDAVNKILIKNDIIAPKLLSENFSKSYIEIQDFGNQTILSCIKKNNFNKLVILKKTINLLNKIQIIRQRKIKNFKKKDYQIPIYTPQILLDEAKLFTDWYIDKNIDKFKKLDKD